MKELSLRSRLMIFFSLIAALVFAGAGILSWQESREKIDEFFDTYQMLLARQLASAEWQGITPEIQKQTNQIIKNIRHAETEDEAVGFAVFDRNGKMIFNDNENGKKFEFQNNHGKFTTQKIDNEEWRTVWLESVDKQFIIAVGQELEYRNDMVWDILEEFCLPWIWGLLILLTAIIIIITREFRPLNRLAQNIGRRPAGDMSPLSADGIPKEVLPLLEAVNLLLKQIDVMITRERGFIADSAHELRTPLTALKVQAEVAQMCLDDPSLLADSLNKLLLGIERASRLVEQLLALSRAEASLNQPQINLEVIDWTNICSQLIEEYSPAAKQKNISINSDINNDAPFTSGNPLLSALLLRNLLDNAIKYSPNNAIIKININDGKIIIANSGVRVDEKHLEKLGQRFYRPAGQNEKGSGLGLSIVSYIASFYGCKVSFTNGEDGFSVTIVKHPCG